METQQAAKEAREAGKIKAQTSKPYGAPGQGEKTEGWKPDPSKGKGQKGGGKGKNWKKDWRQDGKDFRNQKEDDRDKDKPKK